MAKHRFLMLRWTTPIPDLSNPPEPDARGHVAREAAVYYRISQAATDGLGVPDGDLARREWLADFFADLAVGEHLNAERDGGCHL